MMTHVELRGTSRHHRRCRRYVSTANDHEECGRFATNSHLQYVSTTEAHPQGSAKTAADCRTREIVNQISACCQKSHAISNLETCLQQVSSPVAPANAIG